MNTKNLTKPTVVILLALFCCLLWGSAFPAIKIGYKLFAIDGGDTGSILLFAGCRFTLAGILVIIMGSLLKGRFLVPKRSSLTMIFRLCLAQTFLQYLFFYIGLAHTSGVKASIIEGTNVFVALLLSAYLFKERMNAQKIVGCIVGFLGVILINVTKGGFSSSFSLLGEGAIFFSACMYALSSALIKRYSKAEDTFVLSGYQFLLGGLLLALTGTLFHGSLHNWTAKGMGLLFYLSFVSAAAYSIWALLLKYNPIGKISIFGFTNPMFGVLLSALLLGEKNQAFTLKGLLSLCLVCFGIILVNTSTSKE